MSLRSHSDAAPGTGDAEKLGSYVLLEELAVGGLATVHSARQRARMGASVTTALAIKRLRVQHRRDADARARLLDAGRLVEGAQLPYFANVREVHEEPEPFLVMDRVEGITLEAILLRAARKDALRVGIPIVLEALQALEALHTLSGADGAPLQLVHGAPHEGHLVAATDGHARLIDLTHAVGTGITRSPRSSGLDDRLHPSVMAPEQALAPKYVDARCDLFILGGVLWQALTGRALFERGDRDGALQAMLHQRISAPSDLAKVPSRGLERVCMRALERSRGKRFVSAQAMAEALREEAERAKCLAPPDEIAEFVRAQSLARKAAQQHGQLAGRRTTLMGVGNLDASDSNTRAVDDARPKTKPLTVNFEPAAEEASALQEAASGRLDRAETTIGAAVVADGDARAAPQEAPSPTVTAKPSPTWLPTAHWREATPSCPPQRVPARNLTTPIMLSLAAAVMASLVIGLWEAPAMKHPMPSHAPTPIASDRGPARVEGDATGSSPRASPAAAAGALGPARKPLIQGESGPASKSAPAARDPSERRAPGPRATSKRKSRNAEGAERAQSAQSSPTASSGETAETTGWISPPAATVKHFEPGTPLQGTPADPRPDSPPEPLPANPYE